MGNTLNTTFVILLVITLILFTFYYIINSIEIEEDFGGIVEVTGAMQSYEVSHDSINFYHPTKKNTKRYDDKLFDYLEHSRLLRRPVSAQVISMKDQSSKYMSVAL